MRKLIYFVVIIMFSLFCVDLSIASSYSTKVAQKELQNYTAFNFGYGFSLVGECKYENGKWRCPNYSDYDSHGNKRILLSLEGNFNLRTSTRKGTSPLSIDLPFSFDMSYRFNGSKYGEILVDFPVQFGIRAERIMPFLNFGPTISLLYSHYDWAWEAENMLSLFYGFNSGIGARLNVKSLFSKIQFQYRYLLGKKIAEGVDHKKRQTLNVKLNLGVITRQNFLIQGGVKWEKSKTEAKRYKYGDPSWWWDYWEVEDSWTKWSKGELVLFFGIGRML